ncbi:nucleotide sugar dehydrogenase [Parageobacillus galactosidasius]|uniref:UDP-N-acetyl-D-glucosamine dehydrogenase n=1 Tax=Parageobacillus galactosidasius TaxID=883812 RepID=A0A226QL84_9BACL|nr:nucleotide sugar dehydrogenase [Parageobacillus galactosidasius]OXB93135.1 UDP-N-acetyl-D-glucosamine dehydrogenase [Parageobacillus galactosidasius]
MSKKIHEKTSLIDKLINKTAVIGIVGLGYVGLPLAVEAAKKGYEVIGLDINENKIESLNQGINYVEDVRNSELQQIVEQKRFHASSNFSNIEKTDVVIICVPTPLDKHQQPDISYIQSAAKEIATYMHQNMLVVLESTTYPKTTEEILLPILSESGYRVGEDFFLAFSPERVDPGNKSFKTNNIPKVVGGVTKKCTEIAATLYRNILEGDVHEVSSPAVAEMAKILENTFRNINIGLVNEMAIICHKMGIDVWEVIDAAATKPFGFMPFYPGPGLGGHCIPIDPFYLSWKAKEYKYHVRLIETSSQINNYMPEFVVNRVMEILNDAKKTLNGSRVLLLGVSYKKDISDIRESPALEVIKNLEKYGPEIEVCDPYVASFNYNGKTYKSKPLNKTTLEQADICIIITDHSIFDYELIAQYSNIIFDTRNALKNVKDIKAKYYKL